MSLLPTSEFLNRSTPPHLVTLIALPAIGALAMNMFLPSLPDMAKTFRVDYAMILLAVTAFLAVNAAFQLFVGPLSDRYGRRPVTLWSIAAFCVMTVGTIYAPNYTIFMIFRCGQGIIVAGMVLSRAALRDMYDPADAASKLGFVTMGMAMIPMVGPAIGGVLQDSFGWVSNFWLLLICGSAIFGLTYFDMGETNHQKSKTMTAQFRDYPELLKAHRFWGYSFAATFGAGAYFAYLGGAAFVGTDVFGLSPKVLGFYFGAPATGYIIGNFFSGMYSKRAGLNTMIVIGTVITILGLGLSIGLFLFTTTLPISFFGCVTLMGIGNGLTMPNAMAGMLSVRPQLAGSASGIGGTLITGGGALLASFAGAQLVPGTGALTLLNIMIATSFCSFLAICYVIYRDRLAKLKS